MARLTVHDIDHNGVVPSLAAADEDGDTFHLDAFTFLVVANDSGAPVTVTKESFATAQPGLAVDDEDVTVADGAQKWISFAMPAFRNPGDFTAAVSYDDATDVTVGAFRIT